MTLANLPPRELRSAGTAGGGASPTYDDPAAVPALQSDGRTIFGYAAVFGKRSRDLGGFFEELMPGCFTQTLADPWEKQCLWDHISRYVLGSQLSNKTLLLREDSKGLYFEAKTPLASYYAISVREQIAERYIRGCSFSFRCYENGADWSDLPGGKALRKIKACQLFEVSVLGNPAYPDTEVGLRTAKAEFDSFKRTRSAPWLAAEHRIRLLQLSL